jgi:hypothetical protein
MQHTRLWAPPATAVHHAQAPGCGASWTQNTEEVILRVPVDPAVRGKDVQFEAHPKRLALKVKGEDLISGSLADAGEIDVDGESWDQSEPAAGRSGSAAGRPAAEGRQRPPGAAPCSLWPDVCGRTRRTGLLQCKLKQSHLHGAAWMAVCKAETMPRVSAECGRRSGCATHQVADRAAAPPKTP